jgi:hypothetical protein
MSRFDNASLILDRLASTGSLAVSWLPAHLNEALEYLLRLRFAIVRDGKIELTPDGAAVQSKYSPATSPPAPTQDHVGVKRRGAPRLVVANGSPQRR